MDDETTHSGVKLAALEMARNGTTCFLDAGGVERSDAAAAAIEEVGIRGLLGGPHVRDVGPEGKTTLADHEEALRNLGTELKRNSDPDALVRGVVTLSGMGSASDELLLTAKAMADEHGVILNQHQSYQRLDTDAHTARLGRPPLVHLAEIGLLGRNCTFAHVNILVDDEVPLLLDSGTSVAWCPMASMLFGVGGTIHGRHLELYKQGANIALGCDSANWTSAFDIGEQAFIALLTAREKTGRADALMAEDVLEMATINGARAAGMADKLGSIEVGKRADLVLRGQDMPEALPGLDPLRSVVYSSRSKSVDTVIVDGEIVVENGHSARVDEEALFARSREASKSLLKRLGGTPPRSS
jgi:cytosine/adenosine deaminase-related metal-dependent hydrolase